ncbi:cholecystokinin receptor type A-like [Physella acuta]|uniref:cholecystokinin receptor type A-like n=1 Tax=Physella acuta TaxID=109671 RepID=UPI0027DE5F92|nr:cholecystokinin receptor type A-like [Physella acuta]
MNMQMAMEFCGREYNQTNETTRRERFGFENVSRQDFIQNCTNILLAQSSNVGLHVILPYSLIFVLSVVGNSLVILTLVRHKKMRTITNMYLLNLAISDLLLAMFCMPFTLISMIMSEFIFGQVVCVLLRYAQAVSVGVSCGTLVAISLERFYAICQPLKSRRWQTLTHSYRVILAIWLTSITIMVPIAVFQKLHQLKTGAYACREIWPSLEWESVYQVLLVVVLLVVPLFLMGFSYARVARELWSDVSITSAEPSSPLSESDPQRNFENKERQNGFTTPVTQTPLITRSHISRSISSESSNGKHHLHILRPAHNCRVLANKKRVVKMLCVVVLEYFVCWTPLFVVNTWSVLNYVSARHHMTPLLKTTFFLLAYMSSCIHPITYCFMNRRFRQSFADAFRCCFRGKLAAATFYSEASNANTGSEKVDGRPHVGRNIRITWKRQP